MRLKTEIKQRITPRIKAEISEQTGVHYETISNWIKGDHQNITRYKVLLIIANELNMMIPDMLDFSTFTFACHCHGGGCVGYKDGIMIKPCKK